MMDYFLSGGEVVAGLIALVAWWFALRLLGRLRGYRDSRLCFVPCVFLLWLLGGFILIMRAPAHVIWRPEISN